MNRNPAPASRRRRAALAALLAAGALGSAFVPAQDADAPDATAVESTEAAPAETKSDEADAEAAKAAREALFSASLASGEGAPAPPFSRERYWAGYDFLGYVMTPSGAGDETARLSLGGLRDFAEEHTDVVVLEPLPLRPGDGDPAQAPLLATLSLPGDAPPYLRPAMLVVAGLDGRHLVGVEAAVRLIKTVAERAGGTEPADAALAALLRERTLYVVPCLSERAIAATGMAPQLHERPGNNRPFDDDRDGFVDEDRADDLNGDGVLSAMRVEHPDGPWALDPDDPRLMFLARPEKGERGGWLLLAEGRDDDNDGKWNEDGKGGVNLSRNFPYDYPWFAADAGPHQVSEMETRALADFVVAREGIGLFVTLGLGENLAKAPDGTDEEKSGPMETWLKADAKYLGELARAWRSAMGLEKELGGESVAGDFADWIYYHRGRMSLKASLWTPELQRALDAKDAKAKSGEKGKEPPKLEAFSFDDAPLRDVLAAFAKGADASFAPLDPALDRWVVDYAAPEATLEENLDHLAKGLGLAWRKRESGAYAVAKSFVDLPDALKGDEAPKDLAKEREFLAWVDKNAPERFVAWQTVQLQGDYADRRAEVGGFAPAARINPPGALLDATLAPQIDFLAGLLGKMPRLAIEEPKARKLGDHAWEIVFRAKNDGFLPTVLRQGARSEEVPPCWAEIDLPNERFLAGRRLTRLAPLGGGASVELRAIVAGAAGEEVALRVRSAFAGSDEAKVVLE